MCPEQGSPATVRPQFGARGTKLGDTPDELYRQTPQSPISSAHSTLVVQRSAPHHARRDREHQHQTKRYQCQPRVVDHQQAQAENRKDRRQDSRDRRISHNLPYCGDTHRALAQVTYFEFAERRRWQPE